MELELESTVSILLSANFWYEGKVHHLEWSAIRINWATYWVNVGNWFLKITIATVSLSIVIRCEIILKSNERIRIIVAATNLPKNIEYWSPSIEWSVNLNALCVEKK